MLQSLRRPFELYRLSLCIGIVICVGLFAVKTWHWSLVGDAPLLHYVIFLHSHGMVPYRDIVDPNMPGAYLVEGLIIHAFGYGALAWRVFDLALMAVAAVCMISLCPPHSRTAGLLAAGVLTLLHGRDGLIQLGQRDLVMMVLILVAYSFLFVLLRREKRGRSDALLSFLFGLFLSFAATIKPTALLLAPPLLALAAVVLRRKGRSYATQLLPAIAGLLLPGLLILAALLRTHTLKAFLGIVDQLIPYHAQMFGHSLSYLLLHVISSVMLPLGLIWLPVGLSQQRWNTWEGAALLIGFLFGAISFCVQRKAYPYHRYPSEAFLLLWIVLDFMQAARRRSARWGFTMRWIATVGLAYAVFVIGVSSTAQALKYDWRNQDFNHMLRQDLTTLGGASLSGQVQCLDMANGCINVLLDMRLVQSTGFLYNCYAFAPYSNPEKERYRDQFWKAIQASPPKVFIVTSAECGPPMDYKYTELQRWPLFDSYLNSHYVLYVDRRPARPVRWSRDSATPVGYRIYLRK